MYLRRRFGKYERRGERARHYDLGEKGGVREAFWHGCCAAFVSISDVMGGGVFGSVDTNFFLVIFFYITACYISFRWIYWIGLGLMFVIS